MEARIEQLEAELKAKSAPEPPATPAPRGDLVATLAKDLSEISNVPPVLAKLDMSKAVASATGPNGQETQPVGACRSSGGGHADTVCRLRLDLAQRQSAQP